MARDVLSCPRSGKANIYDYLPYNNAHADGTYTGIIAGACTRLLLTNTTASSYYTFTAFSKTDCHSPSPAAVGTLHCTSDTLSCTEFRNDTRNLEEVKHRNLPPLYFMFAACTIDANASPSPILNFLVPVDCR
eukprot:11216862-Lingulodinium_polyedra.AAC.1